MTTLSFFTISFPFLHLVPEFHYNGEEGCQVLTNDTANPLLISTRLVSGQFGFQTSQVLFDQINNLSQSLGVKG
jgi:hypothetical protein